MKIASTVAAFGVVILVSACGGGGVETLLPPATGSGGSGGSGTGGSTPPPNPTPTPTPTPQGPDYSLNGFNVGVNEVVADVTVIEKDTASDVAQNYRSGPANDLRIIFDPARGTLTLFSEAPAFDGTIDGESVTMTASDSTNRFFRNLVSGNTASIGIGEHAWRLSARYDQDDGRFRHNMVAAGGQIFLPLPVSGSANYQALMQGTIEQIETNASRQVPYVARGNVSVSFDTGAVNSNFNLDPSVNGAGGNIASTGSFTGGGNFGGSSNGTVIVNGRATAVDGSFAGFVAGPNAKEVAGVKNLSGGSSTTTLTTMNGAFLGVDPNR